MRKHTLIYGMLVLTLVCSVGLINLGTGNAQIVTDVPVDLPNLNVTLKDVATAPEQYLGQMVTVQGYALNLGDLPDTRWSADAGDFFLTASLESPVEVGIWIVFPKNDDPVAEIPSHSIVMVSGPVVFVQEPTALYRIEAQRLGIIPDDPLPIHPLNNLELFTDKMDYDEDEEVVLVFVYNGPDSTIVELPNSAPITIEFFSRESGTESIYSLDSDQVITPIPVGEKVIWTLSESYGLMGAGYYKIHFSVLIDGNPETLYTKFSIGMPLEPTPTPMPIITQSLYNLELFTDKVSYDLGEEVVLTFINHESSGTVVELLDGRPFEIEFHDPVSNTVSMTASSELTKFFPVPAGESRTWILSESTDLMDVPGFYVIHLRFLVNEELVSRHTRFTVGDLPTIERPNLELFTDKEAYELGEEVTLIFVHHENDDTVVELPSGSPFEIEYHDPLNREVSVYSIPGITMIIPVPAGEKYTWTLSESQGLMETPGTYLIQLKILVNGNPTTLATKFMVGIKPDPNPTPDNPRFHLFTDKYSYSLGENVVLTFANKGSEEQIVRLPNGAPFEIEFKSQDGTHEVFTITSETFAAVIVPSGDSISWILSESEGLGSSPGYYQVQFELFVDDDQIVPLFTRFNVGVESTSSELFTDKEDYTEGENIILTFVNNNENGQLAQVGYCFDLTYHEDGVRSNLSPDRIPITCIEILVTLPVGENITWELTPDQLNGPGFYLINYSFYRGEQQEFRQTQFIIYSEESLIENNEPPKDANSLEEEAAFFIPGFGAATAIITMLAILLIQKRRRT